MRNKETLRQWRMENRDVLNARSKKWKQENAEKVRIYKKKYRERTAEKRMAYQQEWYQKNKLREQAKARERQREWNLNNTEQHRRAVAAWKSRNPDAVRANARAYQARRKTRIESVGGTHSRHDIQWLLRTQRFLCAACNGCIAHRFEVDHIVPISRSGHNGIDNLQLLCRPCNRSKGAKSNEDFLQLLKAA